MQSSFSFNCEIQAESLTPMTKRYLGIFKGRKERVPRKEKKYWKKKYSIAWKLNRDVRLGRVSITAVGQDGKQHALPSYTEIFID